jgi:hypothetical protein
MQLGRVVGALILVGEASAAAYVALIAYMTSGWMIDDSRAFRLDSSGWTQIAVQRTLIWSALALGLGACIVLLNRWALHRLGLNARRASFWLGLFAALLVIGCSVAGSLHFVAEKPFI